MVQFIFGMSLLIINYKLKTEIYYIIVINYIFIKIINIKPTYYINIK